ncbi:hypothetical protein BDZ88DRAFT_213778 [Geranomyces variabilis]|nr:hypothetical protein BDZ88DRAFT_213778 [Geranomyces variabilis]KAJ3135072.1 hypothetical protein HDU90_004100 [Geranomyces variabilis]
MKWALVSSPLLLLLCAGSTVPAVAAAGGLTQITPAPCAPNDGNCLASNYLAQNLPHVRIGGVVGLHARQAVSSGGAAGGGGAAAGGGAGASTPAGGGGNANGGGATSPTATPVGPSPVVPGGGGAAGGGGVSTTPTPDVPTPDRSTSLIVPTTTPIDVPVVQSTTVVGGQVVLTTVTLKRTPTPAPGAAAPNAGGADPSSSAAPGSTNRSENATAGTNDDGSKKTALIAGLSVGAAAIIIAGIGIFLFRKLGLKPSARFRDRLNGLGIGHGGGGGDAPAAAGLAAGAGVAAGSTAGSAGRPVSATPNVRDKLFLHDPHEQIAVHAARATPSPLPSEAGAGTMTSVGPPGYSLHHAAPMAAAAAAAAAGPYYNYGAPYAQHPAHPGSDYGGSVASGPPAPHPEWAQHPQQQAYQTYQQPGHQGGYYDPAYPRQ